LHLEKNLSRLLRLDVLVLLLAAVGIALVLLSTAAHGVGQSADSVAYLSTALSLVRGNGFTLWDGRPYVDWPPLYPSILAPLRFMGAQLPAAVRWLNALTFGIIILVAARVFRHGFSRQVSYGVFCGAVAASYPLLSIHVMAWSEPLFVLLVLAALAALIRFLHQNSWFWLALAIAFCALAALQRLAGFSLVAAVAIALLLWSGRTARQRIRDAALTSTIALLPLALWTVRNVLLTGTLAGERAARLVSPATVVIQLTDTLSTWFIPHVVPALLRVLALAGLVILVFWLSVRKRVSQGSPAPVPEIVGKVMVLWIGVYCFFMAVISLITTTGTEALDERLLSPVYVPFSYVLIHSLENAVASCAPRWFSPRQMGGVYGVVICLWLIYPAAWTLRHVAEWNAHGSSPYDNARWSQSATLQWLTDQDLPQPVFSNHPEAIYMRLNRTAALSPEAMESYRRAIERWGGSRTAHLIWFDQASEGRAIHALSRLAEWFDLQPLVRLSDGTIYRMDVRSDRAAPSNSSESKTARTGPNG